MSLSPESLATRLDACLDFWLKHGLDIEHGGFLTSVDAQGALIDSDKSMWMQGRAAWMFAHLARTHCADDATHKAWRGAADSAVQFLTSCPRTSAGRLSFLTTRTGAPLRFRRYAYSELFAAMGLAEWAALNDDEEAADQARHFAQIFVDHDDEPDRFPAKWETDQRSMRSLAKPMMELCLSQVMRDTCGWECAERMAVNAVATLRRFYDSSHDAVLEMIGPDGGVIDSDLGRTLNPGHALEAAWFLFDEVRRGSDCQDLAEAMAACSWRRGWDEECGGLFAFTPLDDRPIQEPLQQHKYWWPQLEGLLAALHAHQATQNEVWLNRAEQVWDWFEAHHLAKSAGECFGWLDRAGSPVTQLHGSAWKGPFHYPRALLFASRLLNFDFRESS